MSDIKEPKVRTFIGIPLPDGLRPRVIDLLSRLQKGIHFTGANPTWTKPENLHLTLKFLGATDDHIRKGLITALKHPAKRHAPHEVRLRGLGVFPSPRSPKVIWLGAKKAKALIALQADIDAATESLGFPPEDREYSPHLTLARLRSTRSADAMMTIIKSHISYEVGAWPITEFVLYQSTLHPEGSVYTPLQRFALEGKTPIREEQQQ